MRCFTLRIAVDHFRAHEGYVQQIFEHHEVNWDSSVIFCLQAVLGLSYLTLFLQKGPSVKTSVKKEMDRPVQK